MPAAPTRSIPAPPAEPEGSTREPAAADRVPTWALAAAAVILVALAGNRASVEAVAWLAPVPLALAAARLRGWGGRLALWAVCVAGVVLQTAKMITPPAQPAFALLFGVPIGSVAWASLVAWDAIRRRAAPAWGVHAFAAVTVLADWVGFALSPAGAWATSAASHLDDLPVLQLASLGGLGLVGLVVAWPIGAAILLLLAPPRARPWRTAAAALAVAVAAHAWGTLRLDALGDGPTVRVAAVTVDFPERLTSMMDLRGGVDALFARSELAARRGAELVVWNEVATLVEREEEDALVARAAAFARAHGVDLVAAYGVVVSHDPFRIENVYRWVGSGGETLERYLKHVPPPGEPAIAGVGPLQVHARPWGRTAGAICYDYDFPALARQHARGGAGLVVVPSSDWRGIDPQHTLMARVRAIEGGMSVLRAVRAGTSMAFDPYGRVRASMSAWERNDRVMLATLPTTRVPTLYAAAGDWPVAVAAALLLAAVAAGTRRRSGALPAAVSAPPA